MKVLLLRLFRIEPARQDPDLPVAHLRLDRLLLLARRYDAVRIRWPR